MINGPRDGDRAAPPGIHPHAERTVLFGGLVSLAIGYGERKADKVRGSLRGFAPEKRESKAPQGKYFGTTAVS